MMGIILYLVGRLDATYLDISLEQLSSNLSGVSSGGQWKPENCSARDRIAVIIPFMKRERHLPALLNTLHPMLQRQQLDYKIFVINQVKIHQQS